MTILFYSYNNNNNNNAYLYIIYHVYQNQCYEVLRIGTE